MKAVIYARYSTDKQKVISIEGQIRECTEYANKNGYQIVGIYKDEAKTGKNDKRPGFQNLLSDSESGKFDAVIVWSFDRFSRRKYDNVVYKEILKKSGVTVVSVTETISDDPSGKLIEGIIECYSEYYLEELSRKVVRGMKQNVINGKFNGGTLPLGYMTDKNKNIVIDTATAPIVVRIFEEYAGGKTIEKIAEGLEVDSIRNKRGTPISKASINKMLRNEKYIGLYALDDVVNKDAIPPIISDELFNRVQLRLQSNTKAPAKHKAKVDYLLTPKIFCGKCGRTMIGESGTSQQNITHRYYKCSGAKKHKDCTKETVRKDLIEAKVIRLIQNIFFNDDLKIKLTKYILKLQSECDKSEERILKGQYESVLKKIENLVDAIQNGIYNDSIKERMTNFEKQKDELSEKLKKISESESPRKLSEKDMSIWFNFIKSNVIQDEKYRKRLVDRLVNVIYLYDDRMVVSLNYVDELVTISLN